MGKTARVGRPTKSPKPGDRVSLGLRVTAKMKTRLDAAAAKNGRSQSQEAEFMLEQAFAQEDAFGGPDLKRYALLMATAFSMGGNRQAGPRIEIADWQHDQQAYAAAAAAVMFSLLKFMPDA